MNTPDYERIYRRLHPRRFPYSPFETQRELRDLWPVEQKKFRHMVDAILQEQDDEQG